jgi:DNA-binding CsgD family transcriptional regulator
MLRANKQEKIKRYELDELTLSPKQGRVLDLLIAGYTLGEVAELLGVTPGRVTALVKRIGEIALAARDYVPPVCDYVAPKRTEAKREYPEPVSQRVRRSTLAEREAIREAYPECYGEIFR